MTKVFNADFLCLKTPVSILCKFYIEEKSVFWKFVDREFNGYDLIENVENEDKIFESVKNRLFHVYMSINTNETIETNKYNHIKNIL